MSFFSDAVCSVRDGSRVLRLLRWSVEVIIERWERFERAWRERRTDCEDCVRDAGSVVLRELRDNVVSRLR